jgi:PAS domain S-box-containing protein
VRTRPLEALAQMVVVVGLAVVLTTYGFGPFARPDLRFDVPVDVQGILLATFGTVCALVVLTLNLTVGEEYENARQVAAERDRMQNVVDGITGVAIIGADLEGRITLFNPGAQRLLGYRPDEVIGQSSRILHSERGIAEKAAELGLPADFSRVGRALMGRSPTEFGFVRKDGEERRHRMSVNPVVDDRGKVTGYVSTSEDVTERLRAEARLVEALETERQAVEQLREVDRVKDAFVSSVSHELRTPITSILGYTQLLEEGDLGELEPAQLDAVRRVGNNSNRLLSLISELLTLSRVQAEGIGTTAQVVDLGQVVVAGLAVLSPTVARRDVELTVELPGRPVPVTGDREMLERVVINLTDNAVKFTPDGGQVTIVLISESGAAVLEVADTGIGVPANEQQRLFDRFFRSSLAQQRAIPGSGLGLSIAHKIVEEHGGTLEVRSEAGQGSTFRVRLPAAA